MVQHGPSQHEPGKGMDALHLWETEEALCLIYPGHWVSVSCQPGLLRRADSYYQRGWRIAYISLQYKNCSYFIWAYFMLIYQIYLKPNLQQGPFFSLADDSVAQIHLSYTLLKFFVPEALPLSLVGLALSCSGSILELVRISPVGQGGSFSSSSHKPPPNL